MMTNVWRTISNAYSFSLEKRPLLTEMTTSGLLWAFGDVFCQKLESKDDNGEKSRMDWARTFHQALYASIIWGPFAHKWYQLLDHITKSLVPSTSVSGRFIATKLALEMVFLHPVSLFAYFTAIGSMNGESVAEIQQQLHTDFLPTLLLEIVLWTPLDACNFALVPVRHQLLMVNCGCFLESVGLSYIKNNGIGGTITAANSTS